MLAHAGVEVEGERRTVQAVEVFQVQVQRADLQLHRGFGLLVGKVDAIVTQVDILEQHGPGFARRHRGCFRCFDGHHFFGFGRWFVGLAGKQLLPVKLAVFFAGGPGFEVLAVDLADHHFLFGQVDAGVADIQALQTHQRAAIGGIDLERCDAGRGIAQEHFGFFGQVQGVVGAEIQYAIFQGQR